MLGSHLQLSIESWIAESLACHTFQKAFYSHFDLSDPKNREGGDETESFYEESCSSISVIGEREGERGRETRGGDAI